MSEMYAELFTAKQPGDPADGRALLDALRSHVPSWMPHRYGQTEPLRHVFDPERIEHFWGQGDGLMFRNARRTANGRVKGRVGPWDILSRVQISGLAGKAELDSGGVGAFLADCGKSIDIAYAMGHVFSAEQADDYYRAWFELPPKEEGVKNARQGPFPYFLRDLYWANVFGPPYVELFGADRLRTAPAAVTVELRPGYFYLQLTDGLSDLYTPDALPGYRAARDTVKEHLGPDCFYQPEATAPYRAPAWPIAAEEGLWKPRDDLNYPDEVRELIEKLDKQ